MLRILSLRQLEGRRRELVARSEIHRRTLQLELANVKFSVALVKQRFGVAWMVRHAWRFAAPVASGYFARGKNTTGKLSGLISSLVSGIKIAGEFMPLFRKSENPKEREAATRF